MIEYKLATNALCITGVNFVEMYSSVNAKKTYTCRCFDSGSKVYIFWGNYELHSKLKIVREMR